MNIKAIGYTDKGIVRSDNQDSFLVHIFPNGADNNGLLAIVADGVGGENAGSVASMKAVEVIKSRLLNDEGMPQFDLKKAIEAANQGIYTLSGFHKEYQGMATTCSALMIKDDRVITGHVGDCRIYRIRDGIIERLTDDHTLPMRLFRNGEITRAELEDHPQSHVLTNALGTKETIDVDINSFPFEENDTYLICSDGLYKYFDDEEIRDAVMKTSLDSLPESLAAMANERGGSDNITVIVVKVNHQDVLNRTVRIVDDAFNEEPENVKRRAGNNILKYIIAALIIIAVVFFISYRLR